jgi:hypothetical protein
MFFVVWGRREQAVRERQNTPTAKRRMVNPFMEIEP